MPFLVFGIPLRFLDFSPDRLHVRLAGVSTTKLWQRCEVPPPPSTQPPPSKDDTFLSMCVMRVFGSKAYVAALATADFADGSTTMATIGSTPKFGSWVFHAAASAAAASSTSAPNIDIFTVPSLFGEYDKLGIHRDKHQLATRMETKLTNHKNKDGNNESSHNNPISTLSPEHCGR